MKTQPTIFDHVKNFPTEEACIAHFERIRWPHGLECVGCGSKRVFKFDTHGKTGKVRHLYECVDCQYQYSVTTGSIFHDSHLPLRTWFLTIYMMMSAKKGISAKQLQRELGVAYRSAWYMAHRIRLAMQEKNPLLAKLAGIVEVDETYIGGKSKGQRGRALGSKVPVVGMKERTSGKVCMQAVENVTGQTLADFIREHVAPGAEVHTDEYVSYLWLDSSEFAHKSVNHTETYVDGNVHTNGVENVWSLFKRGIMGIYHKVSAKYLPLYLNEFAFRFNNRDEYDLMDKVLESCF